jgi:hypothetical protein
MPIGTLHTSGAVPEAASLIYATSPPPSMVPKSNAPSNPEPVAAKPAPAFAPLPSVLTAGSVRHVPDLSLAADVPSQFCVDGIILTGICRFRKGKESAAARLVPRFPTGG